MGYSKRLIEGNFPCEQVGAETQRERGASSALPPLYFLHVWWARRPLTPSRAALLGSILPADVDPEEFIRELGIVKKQVIIDGNPWNIVGKNLTLIKSNEQGEYIPCSDNFFRALTKENTRRENITTILKNIQSNDILLKEDPILIKWLKENTPLNTDLGLSVESLPVITVTSDPTSINDRIDLAASERVAEINGSAIKIDPEDLYCYNRAYQTIINDKHSDKIVLDCTAGGGSIPFEALRLGCHVIANDLNPVASAIEKATLEYPARYGKSLFPHLEKYGVMLEKKVSEQCKLYFPFTMPEGQSKADLLKQCKHDERIFAKFNKPEIDQTGLLYYRAVTCPYCGERAPLLNAFALQKKTDGWMVLPQIVDEAGHKKVRFVPTRLVKGKGPHGENPDDGTVSKGVGRCIFCGQTIDSEEIKKQARGESEFGQWSDELYCVVAKREQPKLDKEGNFSYFKSGPMKGELKTETVTFFREPNERDLAALEAAKEALADNWQRWEDMDLIPTEAVPMGNDPRPLLYGSNRWCDMFTPRQLLCHLTAMETLQHMKPEIVADLGQEKGAAVVHYLQYMLDKGIDYNSRQTRWIPQRCSVSGSFSRHDFSLKWTFGELIYTGPNSGLNWGKNQVLDAYAGICDLLGPDCSQNIRVMNGSAANLDLADNSVDIICLDPPYYNNVQYAELSDYFYVWQKRTLGDIYPDWFSRRLTNKADEAVANPVRDGSAKEADKVYESRMSEIFAECRRVVKDDGIMVMMFTHKTQAAWQTLTRALIENGWVITASFPVESEFKSALNQKDLAAAASSIFISCRKRDMSTREPAIWQGFGGSGVLPELRSAVRQSLRDYEGLRLNAVDEMVASYGNALKVLSENWPVMNGDELVSPIDAMREASTVVAQYQMTKLTEGKLSFEDVAPEAGVALTLFGIYGNGWFPYDDALSLSRSLNIELVNKSAGYLAEGRMIGINAAHTTRRGQIDDFAGYYAPVIKKGGKLKLVLPEERIAKRLESPQNQWDMMQGVIMAFRKGDIPVARAYLNKHAGGNEDKVIGVLKVWADGCGSDELQREAQNILFGLK